MRATMLSAARVAATIALLVISSESVLSAADPAAQAIADQQKLRAAEDLVHAALLAEAAGNDRQRAESLKQALELVSTLPAARWHAGEIERDGRWLSLQAAEAEAARAGKMSEYRELRNRLIDVTYEDHIRLARWATKAGLKEQERAHFLFALQMQPNSAEAMSKLGIIRVRGEPVEKTAYENFRDHLRQSTADAKSWEPRLNKLRVRFDKRPSGREELLSEIRANQDVAAIPSIEKILLTGPTDVGLAAVDALKANSHQLATVSLARTAVLCDDAKVQEAAIFALAQRPRHTYMPLLLAGLQMPVQGTFLSQVWDGNQVLSRMILLQEGPTSNNVLVHESQIAVVSVNNPNILPSLAHSVGSQQQVDFERRLEHTNAQINARNESLCSVLAMVTGEQLDRNAAAWWQWWYDQNEYYQTEKPTNVATSEYYGVQQISCFVRGTPVWTTTGPMPIEKIKPGESVLSQNGETGELAYKPVLATTRRPTSPVLKICLGNTEIRSTRGHPFWVCGTGWQMAKELKAGQHLHAVAGPQSIDSVEPTDEEDCFNLIVADFHNYFISDAKVLVHDNTLRGPLVARVPGLVE